MQYKPRPAFGGPVHSAQQAGFVLARGYSESVHRLPYLFFLSSRSFCIQNVAPWEGIASAESAAEQPPNFLTQILTAAKVVVAMNVEF